MRLRLCHHLAVGLFTVVFAASAQAQVFRCTDVRTGQVTYTDGACTGGATAREVEPRKTPEELQGEREQAAQALERRHQRLEAEAAAAEADARRTAERDRARAAQAAAAAPQPQDYARSAECARSRRNLEVVAAGLDRSSYEQASRLDAAQAQMDLDCLGPQAYAEVQRARAQQPRVVVVPPLRHRPFSSEVFPHVGKPPPPTHLTQCGDFRCTDNLGQTYPRTGPGRFPGAGGVCRANGGRAPC
jgi:hypothetical protein